jgi:hypothetical protein
MVLPLITLMCWMIALEMIAAIVIEGVFPHFNVLVTSDGLKQDVMERVPRAPPSLYSSCRFSL